MKRNRLLAALLCAALVLVLLPAAALADDLEVHISSDPDDVIQYIPLKQEDSSNLSVNGVNYQPATVCETYGNFTKEGILVEGGDLLLVSLLENNPTLLDELNTDKSNIYISEGKLHFNDGSNGGVPLTIKNLLKMISEQNGADEDMQPYGYDAIISEMKNLKGKKFSIEADDQNLINLGIGNVWQAPVPDKDYDPLSQYVPPYIPPAPQPETETCSIHPGVPLPCPECTEPQ